MCLNYKFNADRWIGNFSNSLLVVLAVLWVSGCAKYEYHETRNVPPNRVSDSDAQLVQEETLLDVGIVLFDPGVDIMDDESAAYSSVRESEAVWYSGQLKAALEYSNAWGIVRTVPNETAIMDVIVEGQVIESNGEVVEFKITVSDASGTQWFSNIYSERASAYAYNPEVDIQRDPFQSTFNQIANDMFDYRASLTPAYLIKTRNVAKVRFAQDFAPQAFADYLQQDEDGIYALLRVPASNDPMIQRIDRIQARNDLFLDVVQDYYRVFNRNMATPYDEWRKLSYKEVLYERQLRKQAKQEKIAGVAVMVAGVLASQSSSGSSRVGGYVGMLSGAEIFRKGYLTQIESSMHAETLLELGQSLESELEPSIIDLQDRSVTLTGTVEDQFKEWRRILTEMFEAEQMKPEQELESDPMQSDDAQGDEVQAEVAQTARKGKMGTTPVKRDVLTQ